MIRQLCRHCGREAVTRPRGLGWKCYYTPGVKDLYPVADVYARHRGEPTEAELEAIIAEQRANLPAWWNGEIGKD